MKIISRLKINNTDAIIFLVPALEEKYNYFYQPTEIIHINDQIVIALDQGINKVELAENMLDILYENFQDILTNVIENKAILSDSYKVGNVGYAFNRCIEKEDDDDCFFSIPLSLCGNGYAKTWIYSKDDKIYLEISPLYPWLYKDPEPGDNYISLQEYMKTYKSIVLYEIDKEKVKEWLVQCELVLRNVDRSTQTSDS